MRTHAFALIVLFIAVPALAQQRPTPVMEYSALLSSVDINPRSGMLELGGKNDALTAVFLPQGAPVEAVITKKGSSTPLHVQDFYVQPVTKVFSRIDMRGKYRQFKFPGPGEYVITFRSGKQVMTQMPFTVFTKSNDDEFDPKTAWYTSGPWSNWAYAFSQLKNGADAQVEFHMWAQRVSFEGGTKTDVYDVDLKLNGDVVAVGRPAYCGTQKWLNLEIKLSHPEARGGRIYKVKDLVAQDGKYQFVIRKNKNVFAAYEMEIKGGKPVLHPRESSSYKPRTEYIVPRYAAITTGTDTAGNAVWMKRVGAADAKTIASGKAATVNGPTAEQLKRWYWLPTSLDPKRPFQFQTTNIETRTDTGFAVGEDLVVFGTDFPTGVKYMKAGDTQAREIPAGETYSSKVFCVCGEKIILTKRNNVFVFDTKTGKLTAIPGDEIFLYDASQRLIKSNGYLVATVNKATSITDRNFIKVIDVSGDEPQIIPIKNATYTDADVTSVAVDAKRGNVAIASRSKKLIAAAKVAPMANQYLYDVSEYRGVASFEITIEDETVTYADEDWKVRQLELTSKTPKAVTQSSIARTGNGFWIRKGRLVVSTKDGKYGSRYPMMLGDGTDAPQKVPGTGTAIKGTSASLGMAGSAAIAIDKTVFIAGTPGDSIGTGERLQMLTDNGWVPIMGDSGKPVHGSEVVTSTGFMALKVRNDAGKTVIGYATYGERIAYRSGGSSAANTPAPKTGVTVPLKFADDNPYNTNDEKLYSKLESYLENEKQVGEAYLQAFGKVVGAKRTVDGIVTAMKGNGDKDLIDDYLRMSLYVPDKDRPQAKQAGKSTTETVDRAAVMAALNGEWKAIRFNAEGNDLADNAIENLRLTFANGKYVMNMGPELQTGTYEINTTGNPMSMTIHIGNGKRKGQDRKGSFKLLKSKRLLIVFATDETGHPQRFTPDKSGKSIMAVYQRVN